MPNPPPEQMWSEMNKLRAAHPGMHIPDLMRMMRGRGYPAQLVFTWRSLDTQDGMVAAGRSNAVFSYHNAVNDNGRHAALAADVVDQRYGWGDNVHGSDKTEGARKFFVELGKVAETLGLGWGGSWSRSGFWKRYDMGWDPAHVQTSETGLAVAREQTLTGLTKSGALGGAPREVNGSGGYAYRQWPTGLIQVMPGSPALGGKIIMPKRGQSRAWKAITDEIGRHPARRQA